jgi:hypothetical protein
MPREFYIPKNAEKIEASDSNAVAYLAKSTWRNGAECWHAVAFSGKRNKPDWNYTFRSEQQAREYIAQHAGNVKAREEIIAKRHEARYNVRAADHYKVGDLLYTSWGYDQTNVEFFKIVRVLEKSVEVVAIGGKEVPGSAGFMSCSLVPDPDVILTGWQAEHNGIKRVQGDENGGARVSIHEHSSGYKITTERTNGVYCSWYA